MKKVCIVMMMIIASSMVSAVPYYGWQSQETVTAGTVGLWQWNESSGSSTVNAVLGGASLTKNGTMSFGAGKFGNGALCPGGTTGTDNWLGDNTMDFTGPDSSLSVAAWINPNTLPTASSPRQVIVDKAWYNAPDTRLSAGYTMYLYYWNGAVYLKADMGRSTGAPLEVSVAANLTTGQWTHLAMTWNAANDTLRVYKDGVVIGSLVSAGSVYAPSIAGSTNPQPLRVGQRVGASYGTFNGIIDDLKISNVAIEYAVPEPATIAMLGIGLLMFRRHK